MPRRKYQWEIRKAKDGWRWRVRAGNRRIVAESGEAYSRKSGVLRAIQSLDLALYGFNWQDVREVKR